MVFSFFGDNTFWLLYDQITEKERGLLFNPDILH